MNTSFQGGVSVRKSVRIYIYFFQFTETKLHLQNKCCTIYILIQFTRHKLNKNIIFASHFVEAEF